MGGGGHQGEGTGCGRGVCGGARGPTEGVIEARVYRPDPREKSLKDLAETRDTV